MRRFFFEDGCAVAARAARGARARAAWGPARGRAVRRRAPARPLGAVRRARGGVAVAGGLLRAGAGTRLARVLLRRPRHRLARAPGGRHARRPAPEQQGAEGAQPDDRMIPSWSSGRRNVAATIIPRMPMKRVSSPTRIAFSDVTARPKSRAKLPAKVRAVPAA